MITFIEKLIFKEKELMAHEYDAFSWYSLSLIRVIIFIYFAFSIRDELLKNNKNDKITKFSHTLYFIAIFSFFILPCAFIYSLFISYYQRFKTVAYMEAFESIIGIMAI